MILTYSKPKSTIFKKLELQNNQKYLSLYSNCDRSPEQQDSMSETDNVHRQFGALVV